MLRKHLHLKGMVKPKKRAFCQDLLICMSFQTCMTFCLLWNINDWKVLRWSVSWEWATRMAIHSHWCEEAAVLYHGLIAQIPAQLSNILKYGDVVFPAVMPKLRGWELLLQDTGGTYRTTERDVKQTVAQMSSNIQSDRDNTLYRHAPLPLEFIHKTIVFGFGERAANKTGKRQLVYWKHHLYWKTGWINQWRNLAFNEWLCHLSKVFEMKACPWSSKVKCSRTEYTDFKNRPITQWGMYTWSRLINGL